MPGATLQGGFDRRALRAGLLLFFLALLVPTAILVYQAYSQLQWEAFHQHRLLAEELTQRIDARLVELVTVEEDYSFADYSFLVLVGDPQANFLQRSPLSTYPVAARIPGLLAYFQVDSNGAFSTPLLPRQGPQPDSYGISAAEYAQRLALQQQVQQVLSQNQLVQGRSADDANRRPAAALQPALADEQLAQVAGDRDVQGQAAFDRLDESYPGENLEKSKQEAARSYARVEDLKLDSSLAAQVLEQDQGERQAAGRVGAATEQRARRKERISVAEPSPQSEDLPEGMQRARPDLRVTTFESEIDPYDFKLLDSGHFVLFRKVWRDGQRYIQGAVIKQQAFVQGSIASAFRSTALSDMSDLIVAYEGNVVASVPGKSPRDYRQGSQQLSGALLYRTRLSAPLANLELIFSVTRVPAGPGGLLLGWVSVILLVVLCGGLYLMYRLGLSQLALTRQQQDFVSAVSHELKTPLTSIRMYGEMLRAGWADEDKKQSYYDYIYHESERLSRLINNVLQLARMTRGDPRLDLKPVTVAELMDIVESKIASQVQRAGFDLHIDRGQGLEHRTILVDTDSFTQVIINLADNALKFAAGAENRLIEFSASVQRDDQVLFSVRDYGPGVPAGQLKKIFTLFYRSESELTRETAGTGIGLALVQQLVAAMNGKVDVRNRDPGAEFRVSFPSATQGNLGLNRGRSAVF